MTFAQVNTELDGALDGSATWENERKKAQNADTLLQKFSNSSPI
ncbi:hypothetical protein RQN30_03545 [Arcanobacterium hippocoleae]